MTNRPLTFHVVSTAPPHRLHAPTGSYRVTRSCESAARIHRQDQDVSSTAGKGCRFRTRNAYLRITPPPLARWVDARRGFDPADEHHTPFRLDTPQASASTARSGSFVARGLGSPSFDDEIMYLASRLAADPRNWSPHRCVRPKDATHTTSTSTRVSFGNRSSSSFRPCDRCVARFTALRTLRQPARAPGRGCYSPRW